MAQSAKQYRVRYVYLTAFLILLGICIVTPPVAVAQQASATVNGVVTDPSGAAIIGAQVDLTNVNTSVVRSTTTNSDGAYAFINVVPGVYTVRATAQGFNAVAQSQVTLEVNQTATFDFHLKVGETQTTVTVEATAAAVESSTAELGTVVQTREVNDLPLNGRNFTELLTITPGVVNIHTDQSSGGGAGFAGNAIGEFSFPSVNGSRVRSNTFLLDGVNNLNTFLSMYNFQPIIDDIQEFKTMGHDDLAEYGGVTGGMVSVVSKSGTNQYHGTVWEFLRNQDMDARGFFQAARVPLRQNQFGVAGGGPIWIPKVYNGKNRTFFYAAYEGYRQSSPLETGQLGPTDAMRNGDFSAISQIIYNPFSTVQNADGSYSRLPFPGNIVPAEDISPLAQAYQKLIPEAGALVNGNNIYLNTPNHINQDEGSVRADQYFGNTDQLMFRYSQYEQVGNSPNNLGVQTSDIYGWNMAIHETHTFGPTAIVDGYIGRNRGEDALTTAMPGADSSSFLSQLTSLGMASAFMSLFGQTYAPTISINGYASFPYQQLEYTGLGDVWQYGGTFAKIIGKHTIKVGADFQTNNFDAPIGYSNETFGTAQTAGLGVNQGVGGNSYASFLLGAVGSAAIRDVHENNHGGWNDGLFVQDQWKATSRLTVNIGYRHEIKLTPIYGIGKDLYTGDADTETGEYILTALPPACSATVGAPCLPNGNYVGVPASGDTTAVYPDPLSAGQLPAHVIVAGSNHRIINNSYDNWAGRAGLAYRISDKMVARAGYGRFYDEWGAVSQLGQNFGGNWPAVATLNNPALNPNVITATMGNPLSLGSGGGLVYPISTFSEVSQWMVDPKFKTPYMDQWNFGIQREMPANSVLDVNYVGSVGRRLDWGPVQNLAVTPGPDSAEASARPYPYMYPQWFDQSVGSSRYNALQVAFNKRMTHGVSFLVSYTLSHSVDDGCSADIGADCDVQDIYDRHLDTGTSTFDETNVFSASFILQSPFGKSANKALSVLAGGWSLNGIVQLNSGLPFSVTASNAIPNLGGFNEERVNVVGNPDVGLGPGLTWFNASAFADPSPYTFGTEPRNPYRADWGRNLDLSLFRQFHITETRYFEFRAEGFNVFNNVVFGTPDTYINDANFGKVTSQLNTPRELQLGLKFYF
jgi:hypothetical protein